MLSLSIAWWVARGGGGRGRFASQVRNPRGGIGPLTRGVSIGAEGGGVTAWRAASAGGGLAVSARQQVAPRREIQCRQGGEEERDDLAAGLTCSKLSHNNLGKNFK